MRIKKNKLIVSIWYEKGLINVKNERTQKYNDDEEKQNHVLMQTFAVR